MLEDCFPLPLGCDLSADINLPPRIRNELAFFLAETSLRAIMMRILRTPDLENCVLHLSEHGRRPEVSPLFQELRNQFDEWTLSLPSFFDWSAEPAKGAVSPLPTRLRLIYWFARFALFRPLVLRTLHDPSHRFSLLEFTLLQDGLLAALAFIKVAAWEEPEVDFIMGNR